MRTVVKPNGPTNGICTKSVCHALTAPLTSALVAKTKLGEDMKRAARAAGWSQAELARQAKVPYGWLRQVTSGRMDKPDAGRLTKVAKAVGREPQKWLALSDQLGAISLPAGGTSEGGDDLAALARSIKELADAIQAERAERQEWERGLLSALRDLAAAQRAGGQ